MADEGSKKPAVSKKTLDAVANEAVATERAKNKKSLTDKALESISAQNKKIKAELKRANEGPQITHALVTTVAAGGGAMLAFKLAGTIEAATTEWVIPEGEEGAGDSTMIRQILVHGTFPVLGLISIVLGAWVFKKQGLVSSGLIGLGGGMFFGGLMHSILVGDDEE